jgi:hypothetical protein
LYVDANLPVRSSLTVVQNLANKVKVLVFLVYVMP